MRKLFLANCFLFACISISAQTIITHSTSTSNLSGNYTTLDAPGLNDNPHAVVLIFPIEDARQKNPHPIGIWYTGSRWSIFNQDKAPMPVGIKFTVQFYPSPGNDQFVHSAQAGNLKTDGSYIDHPLLNNNPAADIQLTQNWNPDGKGGVYNSSEVSIQYNPTAGRWYVLNTGKSAIPPGAAFNIVIYNKGNTQTKPAVTIPPVTTKPVNPIVTIPIAPIIITQAIAGSNLDFEKNLTAWSATGAAFSKQPVTGNTVMTERALTQMIYNNGGIGGDYWKNLPYAIGFKGKNWIGTYENGSGDGPTGTLTSAAFTASKRYLHFLLGGGKDISRIYVELQVKKSDYEAAWGAGKRGFFGDTEDGFTKVNHITPLLNSEDLFRYYFDLDAELNHQYQNKTIRVSIVDNASGSWGHINADDFGLADNLDNFLRINKGGFSLLADKDKPVWGYFDSHTHPAADEGFGKNYYVGSSIKPLSDAWSNAVCTGSHTAGRTLDGFTNLFDPHKFFDGGWPDMWGFPKFNGKMHQKYQVDLIKRAWQGGLKIMCALGINNMYIGTRELGHHSNGEALDDESVLFRQTAVIKEMARVNSDWMEIAYTSQDARRIILEGKLCMILGTESDVFGNFKSPECTWGDRNEDRPLVTITEGDANDKLERKLNEYYALGLRQILPMHYLSKPFGGTAVFNGNTFLPQISFYDHVKVKSGIPDGIGYSLYEDFPTMPALVGNFMTYPAYAARIWKQDDGAETSMVNADGLTPVGNILIRKLMEKGFLVDQEHVSFQSKRDIFSISSQFRNYPVLASHCGPEGLSFIWTGVPVRYNGSNTDKIRNFQTSTIRFVSHEMELNDESMNGIRNTGGVIGVFALLNHKRKYDGSWGDFPNDCPGSTKTLAQMYCYTLDKMQGHGVGLATDLPMVDAVSPRFGPFAAWGLTVEEEGSLKNDLRTTDRMAQKNGVKYDVVSRSYHEELFKGGQIDGFEEDAWKAMAAWEGGANAVADENSVSESGDPLHRGRIRNMVKGLLYSSQDQLMRPGPFTGDAPWEQAAAYCLKNTVSPMSLTIFDEGGRRETANMYNRILPVWNLWKEKNGTNEVLRRHITGNRYWDYNLDGLAHYGLMPDMLQDLKNIGFSSLQLNPLFSSAEDYIRMWEKAEAISPRR